MIHNNSLSARRRVKSINELIDKNPSEEMLLERLKILMKGFYSPGIIFEIGTILHRGVIYDEKPDNIGLLSYPPPEKTNVGRANRVGKPMFYCSTAREPIFFECRVKKGQHITISHWEIGKKLFTNSIGYSERIFIEKNSDRDLPNWTIPNHLNTTQNSIIMEYLANLFTKDSNEAYKISALVAEKLLGNLNGVEGNTKIGGITYPSLAMKANADNLAICPDIVDNNLKLKKVEFIRVDNVLNDNKYQVTGLDFANSFSDKGKIEWKNRNPNWKIASGTLATICVEQGRWVVRDQNDKLIEPD